MSRRRLYDFKRTLQAGLDGEKMKRPSFQFYPADWRKDSALQSTSIAARGLWIEMTCIMHECEPYGHLAINGNPMSEAQLARLVGESVPSIKKLLAEIECAGVFSRHENGCIYSRRMVKDENLRNIRAEAGRLGGNPNLVKQKVKPTVNHNDNQSLTPSSSSSSSSSNTSVPNGTGGEPPKITDPDEIIFGYGVPLLTNAGTVEKQARSFLGGLRKNHGDSAVVDALRECLKAKPLQPLEWLAAKLPPNTSIDNRGSKLGKAGQATANNAAKWLEEQDAIN